MPDLAKVLEGNLNFMKMVTGENRSSYKRLLLKYQELLSLDQENSTDITSLEKELKILLERFESTDGEAKFLAASKFIVFQNFYAKNKNAERFVKTLSERLDFYIKNDEYMHSQEKIKQQAQNFLRPPLDNELLGEAKKTSKGRWRDGKAPNINDNLEALNLFRDTSKDLGYVFHNNEEKTYDVILKDSLIYVNAHINNIGGNLSFNIKKETYEIISLLFRKLRNRLERGLFNSIYFDDVIQDKNYANILNSFKKLTRFGIMHHQTRISDTICDAIIEAKLDESNFPLIRIQNNIDSLFQDILAPIHTVHDGIVKILTIIKQHTTGKGSINIVAREWNNKIVLRITNMNSFPQQEIKDLVQGLDRGDINSLSNTLLGICELNIITNPNNKGYYRIGILPSQSESKHDVDRYNPSGTTYELIFHRTYRVLILDDSGNGERIQQLEDNYNLNNKNSIQVSFKTKVESTDDLAGFNIACVHRSQQEGLSFAKILNFFKSENTPLILIGGGCELREENKKLISVPYTIFSEKINAFYEITARLKPQKLSKLMLMFSSHCNDSNNEKDTLIKKIQTKSITIPLSDTSLIEEVKKITNLSSLPNFKSKEELIQLIKFI